MDNEGPDQPALMCRQIRACIVHKLYAQHVSVALLVSVLIYFFAFIFSGAFTINNVQPQANGESSKVKVKVRVNNHGVFNIQSASMVEKLTEKAEEQGPESMETDAKENSVNENTDMSQSNEEQQNEVSARV